jgi:hypothetical protein
LRATGNKNFLVESRKQEASASTADFPILGVLFSGMLWAGHVARMGEKMSAHRILVAKPEGKSSLGRPRRRWVDNIRMDLREIGWDGMD